MSRTKPPRSASSSRSTPGTPPARPPGRRRLGTILLMLGVAGIALLTWYSRQAPGPRPIASPADTLDAQQAFETAGRFGNAGRHVASVPYFRRATQAGMGDTWEGRFNLAAALINSSLEVETRLGKTDPALRSSYERVQSVREGMDEARAAMRVARDSHMRAYTAYQDAQLLQSWGFAWDALAVAEIAQSFEPGWEPPRQLILELQRDLARGGVKP